MVTFPISWSPNLFVISGYLISASFERNPNIKHYARNRLLRIYPALYACLIFSIAVAIAFGGVAFTFPEFLPWLLGQLSIIQFYNPSFLRSFGTGVLNGSLWTISVELQFYFLLPIIELLIKSRSNQKLIAAIVLFSLFHWATQAAARSNFSFVDGDTLRKCFMVFLPTHLYLFLVGILIQRNIISLRRWLENRHLQWLVLYLAATIVAFENGWTELGNEINPVLSILLGVAAISFATTPTRLSVLLRGNDISYGVYIYHMPIVNILIAMHFRDSLVYFAAAILATYAIAWMSWNFIEKPFLCLKKGSMHPVA